MPYRLTLLETLPPQAPAALTVTCTYRNGAAPTVWPVAAVGTSVNTAVIIVNCAHDLINTPNVATRTLNAHYPAAPNLRNISISSVQPSALEHHPFNALTQQPNSTKETTMSTPYQITISMSQDTVERLNKQKFNLYGFKAVKTTAGGGVPVVWFKTTTFGLSTVVKWTEDYQAYTTNSDAITSGSVTATNAYPIGLDQTLDVANSTGTGSVDTLNGTPNAISILNQTSTPFTCGISQLQAGVAAPMCAFPLNGNMLDVIAPIEQVMLVFSTNQLDTGSVIYQAFSQGVLLNLTDDQSLTVKFDINNSWDWGGGPDGQIISAQANLVPFLIQPASVSSRLARSMIQARSSR